MPAFPEPPDVLSGTVARLRPAAERDIPEILIAHQDDPRLYGRLGLERPPSGAELGRRMEREPADRAAGTGVWMTILDVGSDDCRGQVDVHEVEWEHRRAEIGIWVAPGRRGRGLGTDALRVVGRWLLQACRLERVALLTEPDNAPMRRAAALAGYREEGILRSHLRERGHRLDVVVISLITADLVPAR